RPPTSELGTLPRRSRLRTVSTTGGADGDGWKGSGAVEAARTWVPSGRDVPGRIPPLRSPRVVLVPHAPAGRARRRPRRPRQRPRPLREPRGRSRLEAHQRGARRQVEGGGRGVVRRRRVTDRSA